MMGKHDDGIVSPRPWRAIPDEHDLEGIRCMGIVDANGDAVVETDGGYYAPNMKTAELIVRAVNSYIAVDSTAGADSAPPSR